MVPKVRKREAKTQSSFEEDDELVGMTETYER
jgi:hypothetical protein